jgi:hypothetical protein
MGPNFAARQAGGGRVAESARHRKRAVVVSARPQPVSRPGGGMNQPRVCSVRVVSRIPSIGDTADQVGKPALLRVEDCPKPGPLDLTSLQTQDDTVPDQKLVLDPAEPALDRSARRRRSKPVELLVETGADASVWLAGSAMALFPSAGGTARRTFVGRTANRVAAYPKARRASPYPPSPAWSDP